MLDLSLDRDAAPTRDAATLIVVRDRDGASEAPMEVFCVERHKKSAFLGGAIVFPGGKLDAGDSDAAWATCATQPNARAAQLSKDERALRALAVAACRETLEEAAILPVHGGTVTHDELLALRAANTSILAFLQARGMLLDLAALHPMARWVTPKAEARRYDTCFFLMVLPPGQLGAHDDHETMASFWAHPTNVLERFAAGTVQLAPPTHRTLEILASCKRAADAVALARASCLDPICPELLPHVDGTGETLALVLPGDPAHSLREARVPGRSRFVLRDGKWLPEHPPA